MREFVILIYWGRALTQKRKEEPGDFYSCLLYIMNYCADPSNSPGALDSLPSHSLSFTIHLLFLIKIKHTRPSWLSKQMWKRTVFCGDGHKPPTGTLLTFVFQLDTPDDHSLWSPGRTQMLYGSAEISVYPPSQAKSPPGYFSLFFSIN